MRHARRQAREVALQALYAWQLSGEDPLAQARSLEGFEKTDARFVESLLRGVIGRADELRGLIAPHLSREFVRLSPVERAILYIGAYELAAHPETPFKVVLNEAVELARRFSTDEAARFVGKRGGSILEGYPTDTSSPQPGAFVFHGLLRGFERAGFREVARRSKTRPVVRRKSARR